MNNIIYRVILKVGYNEAWFEFDDSGIAINFASDALRYMVTCDDTKKKYYISIQIVDADAEKKESEDD